MDSNIINTGGGLICDNPNCDWEDDTITNEDLPNWVNKTCPKCGDNVLTESDYDNVVRLNGIIEYLNSLSDEDMEKLKEKNSQLKLNLDGNPLIDKINEATNDVNNKQWFSMMVNTHGKLQVTDIKRIEKNDGTDKGE